MNKGFVQLPRELLETSIWLKSTVEQKIVLITIMTMVNHSPAEWEWKGKIFNVLPGQMITSIESINEKCGKGISRQNIRTALKRFANLQILTDEPTKEGRLITLHLSKYSTLNYSKTNIPTNIQSTNSQPTTNQKVTTNNNDIKIIKNEENEIEFYNYTATTDLVDKVIDYFKKAHFEAHNFEYIITNYAKEKAAAKKIVELYKQKHGETDDQDMLDNFYLYFLKCFNINDDWLRKNMSLSIMVSKTNEINKNFNYGNNKQCGIRNPEEERRHYNAILKGFDMSRSH